MTKAAHDLPQQLDICVSENSALVHIEGQNTGEPVATMTAGKKDGRIARALEITHRFNCHDELVAALVTLRKVAGGYIEGKSDTHDNVLDRVDAIIAKATGQPETSTAA